MQEIIALKKRVLRRIKHGALMMTFEAWQYYGELCVRARQLASVEAVDWLVAEVERTDPLEQLRQVRQQSFDIYFIASIGERCFTHACAATR